MPELEPVPCPICGQTPRMESSTPEGRLKPVWRVVCPCDPQALPWSVSSEAAVRLWNRTAQTSS